MVLEFFGAAGEVTGSCHIVRCAGHQVLLDCGMIQGSRETEARNAEPFPFDPDSIDAVVLSHAHIDHSGRLPLLVQRGFRGPIYAQNATAELCEILLRDSASLAQRDADWQNHKREERLVHLVVVEKPHSSPREPEGEDEDLEEEDAAAEDPSDDEGAEPPEPVIA